MHHIDEGQDNWNYCPLCDDYAYSRDLRSVEFRDVAVPAVGKTHSFQLVKRGKNSTLIVPRAQFDALSALADHRLFQVFFVFVNLVLSFKIEFL